MTLALTSVCITASPESEALASAPTKRLPIFASANPQTKEAAPAEITYQGAKQAVNLKRTRLSEQWQQHSRFLWQTDQFEKHALASFAQISRYWLGTRWALGVPQTDTPLVGHINCGTFVGTVLRDMGFNIRVKKLQRQPSQLIIATFVSGKRVRKYSNASMQRFLRSVREMGPGLFIIGLDFHVGFLVQTESDLRFVHASYETENVIDEPAKYATPIVTSKYRVVGKILSKRNIRDWLSGRRIPVKGKW